MSARSPAMSSGRETRSCHSAIILKAGQSIADIKWDCGKSPAYDGALNKPKFLAPGDSYKATPNSTQFFSRGTSTLKCGAPKRRDTRAGAVHDVEEAGTPTRRAPTGPGFKPGGRGNDLFSRTGGLGPAERPTVHVDPRAGGTFKVGAYKPRRALYDSSKMPPASPIVTKPKRKPVGPGFKAGTAPPDFFDKSMYMSGPGGDDAETPSKRRPGGRWYPSGKGDRPFAARPEHMPDPYNGSHVRFSKDGMFYAKDGCMERAVKGPQMYVCMTWSRACPPVEWGSAKAENMYTKRVAERDGYVYNLMPLQDVPKSMSGRVGQVFTVE